MILLFSQLLKTEESASDLTNGHITGKVLFIHDSKKPAQEVLFSRKSSNITHPVIYFNNVQVQRANKQKHLGIIFDEKLNFKCEIDKVLTKTSKGIAVIKRLINFLSHQSFITIYKAIIRPHLDYGDILNHQPGNATFCQKMNLFNAEQLLQLLVQFKVPPYRNC